jgi:hypothetical protein
MRVNIVYDNQGNVLAAAVIGEGGDQLVVQEGEYSDEFDFPVAPEGGLKELLANLHVDVASKSLKQG